MVCWYAQGTDTIGMLKELVGWKIGKEISAVTCSSWVNTRQALQSSSDLSGAPKP